MKGLGGAARNGILSLTIRDKAVLYAAYMPFVQNGGLFIPTNKSYSLGDEVFMLLSLMDEPEKHTGFTHIALEITDADAVKEQLHSQGIAITETVEFGGATFFFVRDPDGNVIEFHKPAA